MRLQPGHPAPGWNAYAEGLTRGRSLFPAHQTASIDPAGTILSLMLIDKQYAEHARKEYRRNA